MDENIKVIWQKLKLILTDCDSFGKVTCKSGRSSIADVEGAIKYLQQISVFCINYSDSSIIDYFLAENIVSYFYEWSCYQQVSETVSRQLINCQLGVHELLLTHQSKRLLTCNAYVEYLLKLLRLSLKNCGDKSGQISTDVEPKSNSLLPKQNSLDENVEKNLFNKMSHSKSLDFVKQQEFTKINSGGTAENINTRISFLLHQIVIGMLEDETALCTVLNNGKRNKEVNCYNSENFTALSLLVLFLHDTSKAGQFAQDAVLLLVTLSARNEALANKIVHCSDFCPVSVIHM